MKARNDKMIRYAEEALNTNGDIWVDQGRSIKDSYNGSIAALSVMVALTGVRPALAIYYQDKNQAGTRTIANRRTILNVIAEMITLDDNNDLLFHSSEELLRYATDDRDNADLIWLKKEVIECAIALKQVVRTYNLIS